MATAAVQSPVVPLEIPSYARCEPGSINIPIATFPSTTEPSNPAQIANDWAKAFNEALSKADPNSLANLFLEDCYWRDHLALSWDYHTLKGRGKVLEFLETLKASPQGIGLQSVEIDNGHPFRAPQVASFDGSDVKGLQSFLTFKTKLGKGAGLVRLSEENGQWKVFSLFTSLEELNDYPEPTGIRRPQGVQHGGQPDRKNWLEKRIESENYEGGADPTALIVGAGQGGLTIAARLKMLGVDALIVDKEDQIGDNWRLRYRHLVLHDTVHFDHLPYIPFPSTWPVFTPKDKLARWFQSYVESLELNVWTKTTITKSSWDDTKRQWTITLKRTRDDGTTEERVLHPNHVIQATGHSGKPNFPSHIKGLKSFAGDRLCHSSEFSGANPLPPDSTNKKKIVIVGCCNSGHDIAQDFYEKGYDVTMVQRSTTCVVSSDAIVQIALAGLYDESGPPVENADIWLHGTPSSILKAIQIKITGLQAEKDKATLEGLEKAGFKLDKGPDNAGLFMKYFQRGGGYYIDVGASQLIIDGKIKIKQGQEIEEVLPHGIKFADGTELPADEIIFATGYLNMRSQARLIFGDALADRVSDIWGYDPEGEMRGIWRPTGHPGFWFMGGNLALCRYYSRLLALQIKAIEEGIHRN